MSAGCFYKAKSAFKCEMITAAAQRSLCSFERLFHRELKQRKLHQMSWWSREKKGKYLEERREWSCCSVRAISLFYCLSSPQAESQLNTVLLKTLRITAITFLCLKSLIQCEFSTLQLQIICDFKNGAASARDILFSLTNKKKFFLCLCSCSFLSSVLFSVCRGDNKHLIH